MPGKKHPKMYEKSIDDTYFDLDPAEPPYRMECYLSKGQVVGASTLRTYLVRKCDFVNPNPVGKDKLDITQVGDKNFLFRTTKKTQALYEEIIKEVLEDARLGPCVSVIDIPEKQTKKLIVAFRQKSTRKFFSAMTDSFHYHNLYTTRKFVDNFSSGVTIFSFYLKQIGQHTENFENVIQNVQREATLLYCLPENTLEKYVETKDLSVTEAIYGNVGWIFCQHFLKRLGSEYDGLSKIIDTKNISHLEVLSNIKQKLRADTFTREYILEIVKTYPELVRMLFQHFAGIHNIGNSTEQDGKLVSEQAIMQEIKKTVQNRSEFKVFESYLNFNKSVLKTNFFRATKVALSFRLDPSFLPQTEYPKTPFGMFLVIGAGFRGFHIRFRDISRGGIRLIKSRNRENFTINLRNLLDENYGLAATQHRKNKDIPEGGSKGTILLDVGIKNQRACFEKYVDAILDLVLYNERYQIRDLYGSEEILFFGPDEGTADMMDW